MSLFHLLCYMLCYAIIFYGKICQISILRDKNSLSWDACHMLEIE